MQEKRLEWLDVARGIGIILVVIGHAVTTDIRNESLMAMAVYKIIYFFHMPFLFFLSGYAFKVSEERYSKMKTLSYLKDKILKLMVPYITFSSFVYFTFVIANLFPKIANVLKGTEYEMISISDWLKGLLIGKNLYCIHLWYIYTLFIISVLTFVTKKYIKSYKKIILVVALLLYIFSEKINYYGITILWRVCINYVWFALGLNLKVNNKEQIRLKDIIFIALSLVLVVIRVFMKWIKKDIYFADIIDMFVCLMAIYSLIYIALVMTKFVKKCLGYIGKNSFSIYLFQQPYFGSGVGMVLYGMLEWPIWVVLLISVLLSFIIPIIVTKILQWPKMKFIKLLFLGK